MSYHSHPRRPDLLQLQSHNESFRTPSRRASGPRTRRRARSEDRSVPRFLFQSPADIRRKFHELETLQNERLDEGLHSEDSPFQVDQSESARTRNRYSNIAPWESNRVHLNVPEGKNDYINASSITLHSRRDGTAKRYIATQGPRRKQLNHMWRLIWEQTGEVAVVVMLTKTVELGREKCFQYFPDKEGLVWELKDEDEDGDEFLPKITLLQKFKHSKSGCIVRKIMMQLGDITKVVWHLLFKNWPDYGVPDGDDKQALLELIKLANEKNTGPDNPLIVHCSAGVGRSGTFITLDHFLREIAAGTIPVEGREDLIFETVDNLREQRMWMVQSQPQFEFIYTVLRERFQKRSHSASPETSVYDLPATSSTSDDSSGN